MHAWAVMPFSENQYHSSCSMVYLVKRTLNSKASYSRTQREKTGCRDGTRERGNWGGRVEGVRFPRPWGNFVPVLIDVGPFEILLPIKLTVCWATSTVLQTFFLEFLLLYKQNSHASTIQTLPKPKFGLNWCQQLHSENRCHRQTETSVE